MTSELADLRAFVDDFTQKSCPSRLFLDTNVVIAIHHHEMAMAPPAKVTLPYGRKNSVLIDFLRRARIAGSELVVTPVVVEELFHICYMKAIKNMERNCSGPKELRRDYPADFSTARTNAHKATLAALTSVSKHSVLLQMPIGASGDTPRKLGRKIVDAFMSLVAKAHQLDGKDAMHMVMAKLLGCEAFVSNDGDFRFVSGEIVYCTDPASMVR
jgi:predicted nucleic acid-binding protein